MKVVIVDNGGQWTHREWRVLKEIGVEAEIIPNNTPVEKVECDAMVLSGGKGSVSDVLGGCVDYLEKLSIPILGICMGLHIMAVHFGGEVGKGKIGEFGKTEIELDERNELFKELPEKFFVWESHNEEVKKAPENFKILAHSKNCKVEAMRYKNMYGIQFHPEVRETEYGKQIFKNFLGVI